ncbi:DUF4142 domain-containing protein [Methylobacterium oxalidis]|uniref:DUF4142 domain-containing protein n=1 Tax=Methylobacterium oxalidis TaxID=944322 RepID=UPI0033145DCA
MTPRLCCSFSFWPLTRCVLGVSPLLICATPPASFAQPAQLAAKDGSTKALDAATFIRLAHSSAAVQARAAELAATRDTRSEAKVYAHRMVEFRREQLSRLEAAARDEKVDIPKQLEMEHRAIFENLEPLDHLELTRRYAEFQVQALEQEIEIYDRAAKAADERMRRLAAEISPDLRRYLDEARAIQIASRP